MICGILSARYSRLRNKIKTETKLYTIRYVSDKRNIIHYSDVAGRLYTNKKTVYLSFLVTRYNNISNDVLTLRDSVIEPPPNFTIVPHNTFIDFKIYHFVTVITVMVK